MDSSLIIAPYPSERKQGLQEALVIARLVLTVAALAVKAIEAMDEAPWSLEW